jgi:hypothetical protein
MRMPLSRDKIICSFFYYASKEERLELPSIIVYSQHSLFSPNASAENELFFTLRWTQAILVA